MSVAFRLHSSKGISPPEKIWVDGDFGLFVHQKSASSFTVILGAREWQMFRTDRDKTNGHPMVCVGTLKADDTQQFLDALTPVVMRINALAANGWKYSLPMSSHRHGHDMDFSVAGYNQKLMVRFLHVPKMTYRMFSSPEKNYARYLKESHQHIEALLQRLNNIPSHPEDYVKKFKDGEEHIDELQSPVTTHYLALAMFPNLSSAQLEVISQQATVLIDQGRATELPQAMRLAAAQLVLPAGEAQYQLPS